MNATCGTEGGVITPFAHDDEELMTKSYPEKSNDSNAPGINLRSFV